jgi:AcrR family transcriptional regulator
MENFQSVLEAFDADHSPQGRVLRAGLNLVDTMGVDRVTVAAILDEAKVARGTVYAHFGDVFGVFATAWSQLGAPWLRLMMTAPDEESMPSNYRTALVQILCAARRAPVLNEVVQPDVDRVWAQLERTGSGSEIRALWLLVMRLSFDLSLPAFPDAGMLNPLLAVIASLPDEFVDRFENISRATDQVDLPPVLSPFDAEPDDITRRLMKAAVEVVASSGLTSASMLRVCRSARLTPGAATPRFKDLRALHAHAFGVSLADLVRQNAAVVATTRELLVSDQSAAITASSLAPQRVQWRRYRQEFHIASLADPDLAAMMREAFIATDVASTAAIRATGAPESLLPLMVLFTHVAAAGVGAVDGIGLPLANIDDRPVLRWLLDTLTGTHAAGTAQN